MKEITITHPDDWHLHLRDSETLASILPDTATRFARAIIMPNLKPPITTTEQALAYRERILAGVPSKMSFNPLMTLHLTETTSVPEIKKAKASGHIKAIKYYPTNATTNSEHGVNNIKNSYSVFEEMEKQGLILLMHGEVTDPAVDIFDREAVFVERHLRPLTKEFPNLKIVMEHITTQDAAQFVKEASKNIAATLTAHHLMLNRNAIFVGGIRPHHYCLPILKRETHRKALLEAAISGSSKFFLGTDSAPHPRSAKESDCGCAGIYTSHAAIELYAEIFDDANALNKLEAFASFNGPDFYQLPRNESTITLVKQPWTIPELVSFGKEPGVPFKAGTSVSWKIAE